MSQVYLLLMGVLGVAALGSLLGSGGDDPVEEPEEPADLNDIEGTGNPDSLTGTDGDDRLLGLEGNDTLNGGAGNDEVYGGLGNDTVIADAGNDHIFLGGGNDLYGTPADMVEDRGNDTIEGGSGDDTVYGSAGNDLILPGEKDSGDDVLFGGAGNDTIDGGKGNDRIDGGEGIDSLTGGEGNDTLTVGTGDVANGGDGRDDYLLDAGNGPSTITYGDGDRLVVSYEGTKDAPPTISVEKSGDDAQFMVNGELLATLKNTDVTAVRYELNAVQPSVASGAAANALTGDGVTSVGAAASNG